MTATERAAADNERPVVALLTEAEKLIDAHEHYEELAASDQRASGTTDIPAASVGLHFLLDEIEAHASGLQATSAGGALFQICVASHWLELISEGEHPGNRDRAEMLRGVLYSLVTFIESVAGGRNENACREYYMPQFSAPCAHAGAM
jgi:hypothetical protein